MHKGATAWDVIDANISWIGSLYYVGRGSGFKIWVE